MKNRAKLLVVLTFLSGSFALACQQNSEAIKSLTSSKPTETQTYKSAGVVKNIDPGAGKITLDHEEITGYMPAMEMTQTVSDTKMLEAVKTGDKVEFELERTDARIIITKLTLTGETVTLNGGEIFKANCAECHGGAGEGAAKGISFLKGHALKHSEKDFIETVTNGEDKKMPAFKDKLSAEQIAAVVKFIREELQKDVLKQPATEHRH